MRSVRLRSATPRELALLAAALQGWRGPRLPNGHVRRRQLHPRMFNRDQLAIGVHVELEHTREPALALEIAMAHLYEDAAYYARLERMERAARGR